MRPRSSVSEPEADPDERRRERSLAFRIARGVLVVLAVVLVAGAIATQVLVRRAEERHPRIGRLVRAEGVDLHFVDRGSGPPIVLLHGAFGGLHDFEATVLDRLALDYRAIAIDRPGHGYSGRSTTEVVDPRDQARAIRAAVRELGVERPVLLGFSYGAAVALAYAIDHPEEVAGLVTVAGATHSWDGVVSPAYVLPSIPLLGEAFLYSVVTPLGTWRADAAAREAFAPRPVPWRFEGSPVGLSVRPSSFRANAEDMRILDRYLAGQSERYPDLTMPAVIVVGEGDEVASPDVHSRALHADLPRSELIVLPDGGHQLLYTHPNDVLEAVDLLMSRVRGAH